MLGSQGMRRVTSWFGMPIATHIFLTMMPTFWKQFRQNLMTAVFSESPLPVQG
jgi:hypothetical protein